MRIYFNNNWKKLFMIKYKFFSLILILLFNTCRYKSIEKNNTK